MSRPSSARLYCGTRSSIRSGSRTRWRSPATNIVINGLVGNFQAAFEDRAFCREALVWCLLFVALVANARGNADASNVLFHWTGIYGLTEAQIAAELGLE